MAAVTIVVGARPNFMKVAPLIRALAAAHFTPRVLGYRENLGFIVSAKVVLTGSEGMQEETSHLGILCLTLRSKTETPITIARGTNTLVSDYLCRAHQEFANILAGVHHQSLPITG